MKLNGREVATVIFALKTLQREGLTGDSPPFDEISLGGVAPLTSAEIDEFCERIMSEQS